VVCCIFVVSVRVYIVSRYHLIYAVYPDLCIYNVLDVNIFYLQSFLLSCFITHWNCFWNKDYT